MKTLNIGLDEKEYEKLSKGKGLLTWKQLLFKAINPPDYEAAKTRTLGRLQERGFTHPGEILEVFIEELGKE